MRVLLKGLLGLFVLGVVSLGALGFYVRSQIDSGQLQAMVEQKASAALGRKVTLAAVRVDWSGNVVVEKLRVATASGAGDQLTIERIEAAIPVAALLQGEKRASKLALVGPALSVTRGAGGTSDLDDVIAKLGSRQSSGEMPQVEVSVQRGQLTVTDAGGRATKLADLAATMQPSGQTIAFDAKGRADDATVSCAGTADLAVRRLDVKHLEVQARGHTLACDGGTVEMGPKGPVANLPQLTVDGTKGQARLAVVDGKLDGAVDLAGVALSAVRSDVDGVASVKLTVGGTTAQPVLTGSMTLKDVTARNPAIDPKWGVKLASGELAFADGTVTSKELVVEAFGAKLTPKLKITGVMTNPQLELETGSVSREVAQLAAFVPAAQRDLFNQLGASGNVVFSLKAVGAAAKPELTGGIELKNVALKMPGSGESVQIVAGRLVFRGDRATIEPTRIQVRGATLTMSGEATDLFGQAPMSAKITGNGIALDTFADLLPAAARAMKPRLVTDVALTASRKGGAWVFAGEAHPRSGALALQGGELVLRDGGVVTVEGQTVHFGNLPLTLGALSAHVGGKLTRDGDRILVDDLTVGGADAQLAGRAALRGGAIEDVSLKGDVDVAAMSGGAAGGKAHVDLSVKGDAAAPVVSGQVAAATLTAKLENGRAIELHNVSANIEGTPALLKITGIKGQALDGEISGEARIAGGKPSFDVALSGGSVSKLLAQAGSDPGLADGKLNAKFAGEGVGAAMTGHGNASVAGLAVDASRAPGIATARKSLRGGAVAGTAVAALFGNAAVKGFAAGRAAEADFYARVLDEVGKRHDMGSLRCDISVQGGKARLAPISGDNAEGELTIGMANQSLAGHFARIKLGAVEVKDVSLAGSVTAPLPKMDLTKLTLDGKAPPSGVADASSALTGAQPADLLRRQVDGATGGKLGQMLPAGANPTKAPAKLLKGLLGGNDPEPTTVPESGAAAAGAAADPAPPAKKEKLTKKLFKGLFGN